MAEKDYIEVSHERQRLTVGVLGPAKGARKRGGSGDDVFADVASLLKTKSKIEGTRGAYICSKTDEDLDLRSNGVKKDEQIMVPQSLSESDGRAWLSDYGVAWSCKKGQKPESPNQDSFSVLVMEEEFALYGVYDGHGPSGHDVSDVARDELVRRFLSHAKRRRDPATAFRDTFKDTQKFLVENQERFDAEFSGTTCTMAYHDITEKTVTIAHVGDSRCVLGRRKGLGRQRSKPMTIDHKPDLPEEMERILTANPPGRVIHDGYENYRVYCYGGDYPGLNMSRALGDVCGHKKAGISAEPDIAVLDLQAEGVGFGDLVLLLCSDGVWEFIGDTEAVNTVNRGQDLQAGADQLSQDSINRWLQDKDNDEGICDDVTVVAVSLRHKGASLGCFGGIMSPCGNGVARHLSQKHQTRRAKEDAVIDQKRSPLRSPK